MPSPIRVLYVDDDPQLLEIGTIFLEQNRDFSVKTIDSASAAIELLRRETYDAIISDYQMPGMNGIEFLKYLKAAGNTTPFIIFTGKGREEIVIQALNEGADFYLQKGGEPESQFAELTHKTRTAIQNRKAEEALREKTSELDRFFNSSLDLLCIADTDGHFRRLNPEWERTLGYPLSELEGRRFLDLVHPEDLGATLEAISTLRSQKEVLNFSNRYLHKDGSYRWIEWRSYPYGEFIYAAARDITERMQVEAALRESVEKYRNIFAAENDAVLLVDAETCSILETNNAACRMFGYSPEEFARLKITDLTAELDKTQKAMQDLQEWIPLRYQKKKEGTIFPVEISISWFVLKDRKVHIAAIRDITGRKLAEEALKDSETQLRTLIHTLPDLVWLKDPDGVYLSCNLRFESFFGAKEEDIVGKTDYDFMDREWGDFFRNHDKAAIAAGGPRTNEEEITFAEDMHKETLETIKTPIHTSDGRLIGVLGIGRNITRRKLMEKALRESKERFHSLFTHMIEGAALHELICNDLGIPEDYVIIEINPAFETQLGISRDKAVGRTSRDAYGVSEPPYLEIYSKVALTGEPETFETYFPPLEKHFLISVYCPYKGSFATIFEDITERKRAEEALNLAHKKLNLLTSITRHDINNQLMVLQGYLDILGKNQSNTAQVEYFQKARTSAQRISSMIHFTKEYAQIGINSPIWQDCRTIVDNQVKDAPIGNTQVNNDLPAGGEIFADPLIIKVFYNLLDNAVRYGGKITTVRFFLEVHDDEHVIVCEDDGDGIPADKKERIFERGYGKNTGLGLALSREILDITGITIKETGDQGKGARFEMTVPRGMYR